MFTIGLTGNISCGKSSISKILASRGAVIIDADLLSREIYDYEDVLGEMRSSFPESIIDGKIDRKILGSIVFSDKTRLATSTESPTKRYMNWYVKPWKITKTKTW